MVDGTAPRPQLRVSGLGHLPADVTFRYRGVTTAPPVPFDPTADGLGVNFRAQFIFPDLVDVVLPPEGWRRSARSWSYRDATGALAGIASVRVTRRAGGRLAWRILGRHMTFALAPADLTFSGQLRVMLTVAPSTTPSAAAMHWRTPPTESPCAFDQTIARSRAPDRPPARAARPVIPTPWCSARSEAPPTGRTCTTRGAERTSRACAATCRHSRRSRASSASRREAPAASSPMLCIP